MFNIPREFLSKELPNIKLKKLDGEVILEDALVQTYRLLDSTDEEDYNLCLAVICHVADMKPQDKLVQQLLHDCVIKSRVFLYDHLLRSRDESYSHETSVQDHFISKLYTSKRTDTVLTRSQKRIFDTFQAKRRVIVSAPTSFGKTRIVQEIIAHNEYKNIAFIVPTVSLLSEQYQELRNTVEGYTISKSSKIEIRDDKKYLLILTPERMGSFLEENPNFQVDFFVMDEVYKIDYKLDDSRFRVFSDILYRLSKSQSDFYLIGPYIDGFSQEFIKKFDAKFMVFTEEIVQKDFYDFDSITERGFHNVENIEIRIIGDKFKNLVRIISNDAIDGNFLVYRYQKQYVEQSAIKFFSEREERPHNLQLIEYLSRNVSPEWDLINCIKRGVGFHHGGMPRYIQDLIVDEFNSPEGEGIDTLFCTTSLTEGVNTSAKNVILYDKKIGTGTPLGELDRKNIEGRAGRFMRHFVGRIFHLEKPEESQEITNVEMEVFDSPNPAGEALLQVDIDDLSPSNKEKRITLEEKILEEGIPINLIKSNRYVSVSGQLRLINRLRDSVLLNNCQFSSSLPTKEVFNEILSLTYDCLLSDDDKGRDFQNEVGKSILFSLTSYYLFYAPSFAELLKSDTVAKARKSTDAQIRYVFVLISRYFEFAWPKYLKTFESIYNFAAQEKKLPAISLDMVIAQLEYGTTANHEIILRDSGVPSEIVKKISKFFIRCETFEDVRKICTQRNAEIRTSLDEIEAQILFKYV